MTISRYKLDEFEDRWNNWRQSFRNILLLATLPLALSGCATTATKGSQATARLHNDAVRYIVENIRPVARREDVHGRVRTLLAQYCERIGRACAAPAEVSPAATARLLEERRADPLFAATAEMIRRAEASPDLRGFLAAVGQARAAAWHTLSPGQRRQFDDVVAIYRESARLWAPHDTGGLGGGGIRLPEVQARPIVIDWKEVAKQDAIACLVGLVLGGQCLELAAAASAEEIIEQVAGQIFDWLFGAAPNGTEVAQNRAIRLRPRAA